MKAAAGYVRILVWTTVCLVGAIVSFNYVVDPYGIYSRLEIEGVNATKHARETRLRMHKAAAIEAVRPTGLILGSSRANRALDPRHPSWRAEVVYNLATPGGNMLETRRVLEHAHAVRRLRQVIFAADFFMFNALRPNSSDFSSARLRGAPYREYVPARMQEAVATLLSFDALSDGVATIVRQRDPCRGVLWMNLTRADGFTEQRVCFRYDPHKAFTHIIPALVGRQDVPADQRIFYRPFSFENAVSRLRSFEEYERIVRLAYADDIDLRVVVLPVHAWQLEVIQAEGLWPSYERWKRELLAVASRNAKSHARIPVWDFTAYNALTTEEVPLPGRSDVPMRWYVDPSHPTKEFGDRVLDIVLADGGTDGSNPHRGLGVRLSAEIIDDHLAGIRSDRNVYARRNETRLQEVYRLVR